MRDNFPDQPLSFCVNGGSCNAQIFEDGSNSGCDCPETYTGVHCELIVAIEENQASGSKVHNVSVIVGCLLVLLGIFALFMIFNLQSRIRMIRKQRPDKNGVKNSTSIRGETFSQRRRRVAGFDGLSKRNSTVSSIEMSSSGDTDIDQIIFDHHNDNDGIVNDHFGDERQTIENPVFVENSSFVNEKKLQCPHFV